MSNEKTPEQQAAERYPVNLIIDTERILDVERHKRIAYTACLTERAIPAEQRVKELEAEVQRLRDAGNRMKNYLVRCSMYGADGEPTGVNKVIDEWDAALTKLAKAGVTPTNP